MLGRNEIKNFSPERSVEATLAPAPPNKVGSGNLAYKAHVEIGLALVFFFLIYSFI